MKFYLVVYGSIGLANTVFTGFRAVLFAYGAICAATTIHNRLLDRVLKVQQCHNHCTTLKVKDGATSTG